MCIRDRANNVASLPAELLRKGRFDEIFFLDLPGEIERMSILKIHLEKRGRDPAQFDIPRLSAASTGYSGAELEQAVIAMGDRQLVEQLLEAALAQQQIYVARSLKDRSKRERSI